MSTPEAVVKYLARNIPDPELAKAVLLNFLRITFEPKDYEDLEMGLRSGTLDIATVIGLLDQAEEDQV